MPAVATGGLSGKVVVLVLWIISVWLFPSVCWNSPHYSRFFVLQLCFFQVIFIDYLQILLHYCCRISPICSAEYYPFLLRRTRTHSAVEKYYNLPMQRLYQLKKKNGYNFDEKQQFIGTTYCICLLMRNDTYFWWERMQSVEINGSFPSYANYIL